MFGAIHTFGNGYHITSCTVFFQLILLIGFIAETTVHSPHDGEITTRPLSLEDLLAFITGASKIPPMGFGASL